MDTIKGLIWMMLGVGVTLVVMSEVGTVRQVGQVMAIIALLWRLLLYLRDTQPSMERINAVEQSAVSRSPLGDLTHGAPLNAVTRREDGRSPVERLLAKDE